MAITSPQLSNAFLEIDTKAIKENITYLKSLIPEETKLMVMVKSFGYGLGAVEVSNFLQINKLADYLAVATIYKGIELREEGIDLPIMVTNPVKELFDELIKNCLEPVIHHIDHLNSFLNFLNQNNIKDYPIHLKFNTGMNRFGFNRSELNEVIKYCKSSNARITSVMSHLSSADIENEDVFTLKQISAFHEIRELFQSEFSHHIDFHILNSNGLLRFPQYAMDMVRSGIAVFGVHGTNEAKGKLKAAAVLKSKIAQIRKVAAGESVSYSRNTMLSEPKKIAVISIGYANGFPRNLSDGKWHVEISGQLFPTIGNVCMDYTLIDISNSETEFSVGDTVTIFGGQKTIIDYANAQGTISYEALTNLGQAVDRLFI